MFKITGEPPKVGDVVEYPGIGPMPLVSVYLRADAISDGELIDCTQDPFDDLNRNAGLLFDVAITRAVFERYVEVPEDFKGQQDILGRYWDIVFMFRLATSRSRQVEMDTILFEIRVHPERQRLLG